MIRTNTRRMRAFTLVEILIVLTVIALLAGILLPVFSKARERARSVSCQNNLRQIGLGLSMYVQDNNRFYPQVGDLVTNCSWVEGVKPYVKNMSSFECPAARFGKYVPGCPAPKPGDGYVEYFSGSYLLNTFVDGPPIRDSRIRVPSETILVTEGENPLAFNFVPASMQLNEEELTTMTFMFRHNSGSNNLFADGHVKWLSVQAMTDNQVWLLK